LRKTSLFFWFVFYLLNAQLKAGNKVYTTALSSKRFSKKTAIIKIDLI
jgi:hypothetical protein